MELQDVALAVGANVEAKRTLAGHLCQGIFLGICVETPDREGHRPRLELPFLPRAVQAKSEFRSGQSRILPELLVETDVSIFAGHLDVRIAEVAWNTCGNADGTFCVDERGRLLDVNLKERTHLLFLKERLSPPDQFRVATCLSDVILQSLAGVDPRRL